ncbi:MAG: alginate lyase family protein [Nitrospiria bacterium]
MTTLETNNVARVLRKPYEAWPPERVLSHFKHRSGVHYFPVIDALETGREKIDHILQNRFEFNHESYQLSEAFEWSENPSSDIEWLILLHKFYYAVGLGMAFHETKNPVYLQKWIDLTSSWINTVPLGFLSSDVAGRRIQNWIYAHYYFVTLNPDAELPSVFYVRFLESIYDQVCHLANHLTPSRNHRTLELYAIFLAAVVFPELKGANMWLAFAKEELGKNIQTDILADGVHCELSTDYHHIVLKNYLNIRKLAALNDIDMPREMDTQIRKALEFSLYVHKPDGLIPSLSDGDTGCFLELLKEGHRLYNDDTMRYVTSKGRSGHPPSDRSKGFAESGYYILRSGWGGGSEPYEDERYLVFDCGPLGEGNHGHLDCLSFEMAAYGQSLIVDPGRYTYDESGEINWRVRFRGTAYHNTVLVDQKNQTKYLFHKRKFKIKGPAPDHEIKAFISQPGFDFLHGAARSHEYDVVHERKIFFPAGEYWVLSDFLHTESPHDYDRLFHLSDQALGKISVDEGKETLRVDAPHLVIAQPVDAQVRCFVEEGYVSRIYGVKSPAPVIRYASRASSAAYHTVLYPYKNKGDKPDISVEVLPVFQGDHMCEDASAFALSITVERPHGDAYQDIYFSASSDFSGPCVFGDFTYSGKLLFVRKGADGKITCLHREAGSLLKDSGEAVL